MDLIFLLLISFIEESFIYNLIFPTFNYIVDSIILDFSIKIIKSYTFNSLVLQFKPYFIDFNFFVFTILSKNVLYILIQHEYQILCHLAIFIFFVLGILCKRKKFIYLIFCFLFNAGVYLFKVYILKF